MDGKCRRQRDCRQPSQAGATLCGDILPRLQPLQEWHRYQRTTARDAVSWHLPALSLLPVWLKKPQEQRRYPRILPLGEFNAAESRL